MIATTNLGAMLRSQGEELKKNVLLLKRDILLHYQCLRYRLEEMSMNFMRKKSTFKDVTFLLIDDITAVWIRATLPVVSNSPIETKLTELVEKWNVAMKRARWTGENAINGS